MRAVTGVQSGLARGPDKLGTSVMDIVGSVIIQAAVAVVRVIVSNERGDVVTSMIDGFEPDGKVQVVLDGLERRLTKRVVIRHSGPGNGQLDPVRRSELY